MAYPSDERDRVALGIAVCRCARPMDFYAGLEGEAASWRRISPTPLANRSLAV
jgi:hypothetical protein